MKRLIYTLARLQHEGAEFARATVEDAVLGITMAALGLPGVRRAVCGSPEVPKVLITFPDDKALLKFNLRIERALAVRGVKIRKIEVVEATRRSGFDRAVA